MEKKNLIGQIHDAMYQNIKSKGYVAPVDILMDIGVLLRKDYDDWRYGRVVFLEKVCRVNLRVLSNIMKEIRAYAKNNNLKPSYSCYHQWGKNKDKILQFSKSSDKRIELNYSTHFVDIEAIQHQKNNPGSK